MAIDTTTPRPRRAILVGALGGAIASLAGLARAVPVRAGVDGDLVLEATNNTDAMTELVSSAGPSLRVVGGGTGLQAWGGIAVDAFGDIGVNALSDSTSAPANIGFNRGNAVGVLGWSANGNQSTPPTPAKTGVFGLAEQDAEARGVVGRTTAGQGVRGEATTGIGVAAVSTSGPAVEGFSGANGVIGVSEEETYPATPLGAGVQGHGPIGVFGSSVESTGLIGVSGEPPVAAQAKTGVYGLAAGSSLAQGVFGESDTGTGALGRATSGKGVRGEATTGIGVAAVATDGTALEATNAATGEPAMVVENTAGIGARVRGAFDGLVGESANGASGIVGYSGAGVAPAGQLKTGVYGTASQDANSRGVHGMSTAGRGVYGASTTGLGVRGYTTSGTGGSFGTSGLKVGLALRTTGRVRFDNCVGVATIPAGTSSVVVTPGIDLTSGSAVVATLMGNAGGTTTVQRVAVNATADTFTIFLTANSTTNVKVAWHVFG